MQKSLPPLPPLGTSPPTHCGCYYIASIQPIEDLDALWLQLPLPEIEIERPKWKPHPWLYLDLIVMVKKIVNLTLVYYFFPPKTGKEFNSIKATFNRFQDYAFIKGFLVIKYSGNFIGIKRPY